MRFAIYIPDSLATQIRDDAEAKGQTLSMWFTRAAEDHLIQVGLTPKEQRREDVYQEKAPTPASPEFMRSLAELKRRAR